MTLMLSNQDVDELVTMPECIDILEDAYRELAQGRGVTRRRSDTFSPTTRKDALYSLKSMDGIMPKLGVGAVRINSDIVTWPSREGNARREKVAAAPNSRWVGLVLLFSVENGEPLAILPDGYVQRLRVGATNGLGMKYLARTDARVVGLLGSGWQASGQAMAAAAVRDIEQIRCFSPNRERREAFTRALAAKVGVEIVPVNSAEQAVRGADVVMCATNSIDAVFFARWIEPGMHISSIKRPEVEIAAIKRADRVVLHTHDPTPMHFTPPGLAIPEKVQGKGWTLAEEIDFDALPDLKDLVSGKVPKRRTPQEITCFLNNMGMGYQFSAVGAVVYRKAKEQGRGHSLPTEWFTQDVHP